MHMCMHANQIFLGMTPPCRPLSKLQGEEKGRGRVGWRGRKQEDGKVKRKGVYREKEEGQGI
jgi:hypothetical protein